MQFKNRASLCTLALAAISAVALAGPLTPPAGPVTSTNKTLQEVEPRIAINATNTPGDADALFKITQRGSYYLTGNITGVVGRHGIEIVASGVTLDLMGFDVSGVPAMGGFDGVSVTISSLTNITIRNGTVRGWGDEGVDLRTFRADNSAVIDVRASSNAGSGIRIGNSGTVTGCSASFNTGSGISIGDGSTVAGCTASSNTGTGIVVGVGSTITGCSAFQNTGNGISTFNGSTIIDCTAYNNTGDGIFASFSSAITGCTAFSNTGNGILAQIGSTVTGSTASSNTLTGIVVGIGSTITGCTASFNTGNGIATGAGCTITGCTAFDNTSDGIHADSASTVSGCTTRSNDGDGIQVSSDCRVINNTCDANGTGLREGAGIYATGSGNRIEGNNCSNNDRGIDVDAAGNIIIRNTCSGNTPNWTIVANNFYGPISSISASTTPAANCSAAAASTLATADPNANFSY